MINNDNNSKPIIPLATADKLARLALAFGRVERATYHEDGDTPESDATHTVPLFAEAAKASEGAY